MNKLPFLLCLLFWLPNIVAAHQPDQSYTFIRVYDKSIGGRFEITSKDINRVMGTDIPPDFTLETLQPYLPQIKEYVLSQVAFTSTLGSHPIRFTEVGIHDGEILGRYVQLNFDMDGITEIPESLDIKNGVGLQEGHVHRGLLVIEYNWKAGIHDNESMVSLRFSPNDAKQNLSLTGSSIWKGFLAMIESGMWHIYIGLDHILFLLALLLPSVIRRQSAEPLPDGHRNALSKFIGHVIPVDRFRPAFIYVIKIITFFTIAHTITLSLAALEIVVLPSRIVESIIALSIALAALNNIRPVFKHSDWAIVFGFGLFHGFGFASVLGQVGLQGEFMTLSLLGFNLGVEIGQVLIISAIFPFLYFLRKTKAYPYILVLGSVLLIFISMQWTIERFFDIDIPIATMVKSIF